MASSGSRTDSPHSERPARRGFTGTMRWPRACIHAGTSCAGCCGAWCASSTAIVSGRRNSGSTSARVARSPDRHIEPASTADGKPRLLAVQFSDAFAMRLPSSFSIHGTRCSLSPEDLRQHRNASPWRKKADQSPDSTGEASVDVDARRHTTCNVRAPFRGRPGPGTPGRRRRRRPRRRGRAPTRAGRTCRSRALRRGRRHRRSC